LVLGIIPPELIAWLRATNVEPDNTDDGDQPTLRSAGKRRRGRKRRR